MSSTPQRIWIDAPVGAVPGDTAALAAACRHPSFELVGVSISGAQQSRRVEEAYTILEHLGHAHIRVYEGNDLSAETLNDLGIEHTITLGPLTNIARLILDEAQLGHLHLRAGCFTPITYRDKKMTVDENIVRDLDAARIVLTQYENLCINSFEAAMVLTLDEETENALQHTLPFLTRRIDGYRASLETSTSQNEHVYFHGMLPLLDIANMPTITREVIEFTIQPDGSFRRAYELPHRPPTIDAIDNPLKVPVPKVSHNVLRAIDSAHALAQIRIMLGVVMPIQTGEH